MLLDISKHLTAQKWVHDSVLATAQQEVETGSAQGRALAQALQPTTFDTTCWSALQSKEIKE